MQQITSLAAARKSLGLTQPALADELGVDIATIWRWEKRGVPKSGVAQIMVDQIIARAEKAKSGEAA